MWLGLSILGVIIINAVSAIITVFRQPRDIAATWGWLLVLLLLPVIGFCLYWLFGRKLSSKKLNTLATQQHLGIDTLIAGQQEAVAVGSPLINTSAPAGLPILVRTLLQVDGALVTTMNDVHLIAARDQFTASLMKDVAAAVNHIHIEAYTIEPDATGQHLVALLTKKASEGVRVRVIYDSLGSHRLTRKFWAPLRAAGGQVEPFFATKLGRINPRVNFRNHRKLTVIDGTIGYMGGFDIGSSPHHLPIHRDTQLRITGQAVAVLQAQFFLDWNTTAKIQKVHFQQSYFPAPADTGTTAMQIVAGGPEQPMAALKLGYLRLLTLAKTSIWLQTPYFVPDDSLLDALTIAANAGIDVRIMVPVRTNQPLMAKASQYYLDVMVQRGAKVYRYTNGFLHAKTIVVDEAYVATGTANFDLRSFTLNFELAAFIYDRHLAREAAALFTADMAHTVRYTKAMVAAKRRGQRLSGELSRLLAPIL